MIGDAQNLELQHQQNEADIGRHIPKPNQEPVRRRPEAAIAPSTDAMFGVKSILGPLN